MVPEIRIPLYSQFKATSLEKASNAYSNEGLRWEDLYKFVSQTVDFKEKLADSKAERVWGTFQ